MQQALKHILKRLNKINREHSQDITDDLRDQRNEKQLQRQQLSIPPFLTLDATQKTS